MSSEQERLRTSDLVGGWIMHYQLSWPAIGVKACEVDLLHAGGGHRHTRRPHNLFILRPSTPSSPSLDIFILLKITNSSFRYGITLLLHSVNLVLIILNSHSSHSTHMCSSNHCHRPLLPLFSLWCVYHPPAPWTLYSDATKVLKAVKGKNTVGLRLVIYGIARPIALVLTPPMSSVNS